MLIDRADRDIYNAKWLISSTGNPSNDELLNDMAACHVQQGIEKSSEICPSFNLRIR